MVQHSPEITSPSPSYTATDLQTVNAGGNTLLEEALHNGEREKACILLQAYEEAPNPDFCRRQKC